MTKTYLQKVCNIIPYIHNLSINKDNKIKILKKTLTNLCLDLVLVHWHYSLVQICVVCCFVFVLLR